MCGIVCTINKQGGTAVNAVLKRFNEQRERGVSGFGFATFQENRPMEFFLATTEAEVTNVLHQHDSNAILFHHRIPTSTPNYAEAAHPFRISSDLLDYNYVFVHNGVLRNYLTLLPTYKEKGFVFRSEYQEIVGHTFINCGTTYSTQPKLGTGVNDSEVLGVDMALYLEGKQAMLLSNGTISFIAIRCTKNWEPLDLIYGHNSGNPLILEEDKNIFCLKSTGSGESLPIDTIYVKNLKTGKVVQRAANGLHLWIAQPATPYGYNYGKQQQLPQPTTATNVNAREDFALTNAILRILPDKKDDDVEFDTLPEVLLEDSILMSETDAREVIRSLTPTDPDTAGVLVELLNDIKGHISNENDAIDEFNAAQDLFRESARVSRNKHGKKRRRALREVEEAKALMEAAERQIKEYQGQRVASEAEFEAHMSVIPLQSLAEVFAGDFA